VVGKRGRTHLAAEFTGVSFGVMPLYCGDFSDDCTDGRIVCGHAVSFRTFRMPY
jgi:hypothetical protein